MLSYGTIHPFHNASDRKGGTLICYAFYLYGGLYYEHSERGRISNTVKLMLLIGQGCHQIRGFRENQGILFSIRENQGEKKDSLINQGKSGKS